METNTPILIDTELWGRLRTQLNHNPNIVSTIYLHISTNTVARQQNTRINYIPWQQHIAIETIPYCTHYPGILFSRNME